MPRDWTERHIIELIKKHGSGNGTGDTYIIRDPIPRVFEMDDSYGTIDGENYPNTLPLGEMSETARELLGKPTITYKPLGHGGQFGNYIYQIGNIRLEAASNPQYTANSENVVYGYGLPTPINMQERYQDARAAILNTYCGFSISPVDDTPWVFSIPKFDMTPNIGNVSFVTDEGFQEVVGVIIPRSAIYKLFNDAPDVFTLIRDNYYYAVYMINTNLTNQTRIFETLHIYTPNTPNPHIWYLLVDGSVRGIVSGK